MVYKQFKRELPDVHFGPVTSDPPDYKRIMRENPVIDDDDECEDEEGKPTDPSIIRMLGFDPAEWEK